ncbi:ABC transporter permease [Anaeromicropila populeti]|uniref:Putative ABC transport system permease protein n=1 Tax=Anaeromicropila populeti TaxID=37658 RepID=A0A1I6J955_9FIRM|nr:ABC transporter permease [Anaeromicropila populeti]SFR75478.1 putative ABC transport system permease protein [Anaeromicropila populeti]
MLRVNNRKTVRRLAGKSYKSNEKRNRTAIIAIILTTVLFSAFFTIGLSLAKSLEYNSMRLSGGMGHASLKYLSDKQYDELTKNPLIKKVGKSYFCGTMEDGVLIKRPVELNYKNKEDIRQAFMEINGEAPVEENELVLDSIALDMLGLEHKAGQKISLLVNFDDHTEQVEFTLSGWYEGDPVFNSSIGLVSEAFKNKYLAGRGQKYNQDYDAYGSCNANIMFQNSSEIEERIQQVITEAGYSIEEGKENSIAYGVNWSYISTGTDGGRETKIAVAAGLLLIMLTGYLIIYNIFQISVIRDIRFYGLLKTIGTTGNQIRRILIYQALRMSVLGIPIGLVTGYGLGLILTPIIAAEMYGKRAFLSRNPLIFAGAVLFSLITVFISCIKPARIASRISPVEAVKYSGVEKSYLKKQKRTTHGAKLYKMAFSNLGRNKKRTVIAVISMSLSLILMNMVFCLSSSFDLNLFIKRFIDVDYQLAEASYFNSDYSQDEDPVSDEFIKAFQSQQGFVDGGSIYTNYSKMLCVEAEGEFEQWGLHYSLQKGDVAEAEVYGMDSFVLDSLKMVEGEFDAEKFATGKYVLLGVATDDQGHPEMETACFHTGDNIKLKECTKSELAPEVEQYDMEKRAYVDKEGNVVRKPILYEFGSEKEYEIMGIYELSWTNMDRSYGSFAVFSMPTSELQKWSEDGRINRMSYLAEGEDELETQLDGFLEQYTSIVEPTMNYASKKVYHAEFDQLKSILVIVGSILSGIIGFIGILNFINSVSTGIIARKKEFAMLRSIGMTVKQLKKMLVYEGIYYLAFTIMFSVSGVLVTSFTMIRPLADSLSFLIFKLTLAPVLLAVPVLAIITGIIPLVSYRSNVKKTVVELIRDGE